MTLASSDPSIGRPFEAKQKDRINDAQLAREVLASIGKDYHPPRIQLIKALVPIGFILLVIVAFLGIFQPKVLEDPRLKDVGEGFETIASLVTALAFAIALWQWIAARHEASFDKYYDRLNTANTYFDAAKDAFFGVHPDPEELKRHKYNMFIYSELDNLEYILEKHCLGYVEIEVVGRAMKHFKARCKEKDFCDAAVHWVGQAGYKQTTQDVVHYFVGNPAAPGS